LCCKEGGEGGGSQGGGGRQRKRNKGGRGRRDKRRRRGREEGGETKEVRGEGVEESKKKMWEFKRGGEGGRKEGKGGRGNILVAHSSPISEDIGQFEESSVDENGKWESIHEGWELDDGLTLLTHPAGVEACTQTHMQAAMVRIVKYVVFRPHFVALSQPSSLVQLG